MADSMPPSVGSAGTANTFASLQSNTKTLYGPSPSKKKKRFAKIREVIEGKR